MFSMGLGLTFTDFKRLITRTKLITLGISIQYLAMPALGFLIAVVLQLPLELMAGLVLVGACPGGTASNLICYLARGDVALSITMTILSTLCAVVLTPLLSWIYLSTYIDVPAFAMFKNIFLIILAPVTCGLLINQFAENGLSLIKPLLPAVSMAAIILILSIIVALNKERLAETVMVVFVAVMLHNMCGLILGYMISRKLGFDNRECRTIAIEVAMQNSGLAVQLAFKYFPALAALPAAIFSIWHNVSGAIYATYCRYSDDKKKNDF